MKLGSILISSVVILICASMQAHAFNAAWRYYKVITLDASMTPNADQTNIPVLIYRATDTDLRDNAAANGDDILFTDSTGTIQLSHEIEKYIAGTGELVAWVKIPTLANATNTTIRMYYGDTGGHGNQENIADVWSNGYSGVLHLDETPNDGVAGNLDSTSNNNHGTPKNFQDGGGGSTDGAGRIDGANEFAGDDDYVDLGSSLSLNANTAYTVTAWIKTNTGSGAAIASYRSVTALNPVLFQMDLSNFDVRFIVRDNAKNIAVASKAGVLTTGAWFHVAGVRDGGTLNVYINGAVGTPDSETFGAISANSLNIGAIVIGNSARSGFFDGIVDDVRISNIARDANWIMTQYNIQSDYFADIPQNYVTYNSQIRNLDTGTFQVSLSMSQTQARRGEILRGTITVANQTSNTITNTKIMLGLPGGLTFRKSSTTSPNFTISNETTSGAQTTITLASVAANTSGTIDFQLSVGPNVEPGNVSISLHTEND